ncbi:2TM domain-containing protein [Flavobacterium sp. MDT1-60]|uniref:2TM domain-containing protein n=1 Tax=Flavobacterium sp. MDT1-60 TaxID=1979344 RepID=UPI00177E6C94|nr:2TM domain-containing protein [Flavobacterium sp. MDT1-60]QOG04218.1 2TM domain-containing protein [Flavobacterium sp. MDT1-60]
METNCNKAREKFEFQEIFSKKVIKLKSFYIHAFIYAFVLIVYVLKEYYEIPLNYFPLKYLNSVVMIIWTTVFLFSAIDLFASYKIFDEKWEERKLKSILYKKTKTQKWE